MPLAAFSALLLIAVQPAQAAADQPLPEAAYLLLGPEYQAGADGSEVIRNLRRLLVTMDDLGTIHFRHSALPPGRMAGCLSAAVEAEDRASCIRPLLPADEGGVPLVAITAAYTDDRPAHQRVDCTGPAGAAHEDIYLQDGFHIRDDIRAGVRAELARCIRGALRPGG